MKRRRFHSWIPLLLGTTLAAGPQQVEPPPSAEEAQAIEDFLRLLNTPVTTATKDAMGAAESPAVITVITAEQIRESGYETVAQALRTVPGLSIWEDNLISSISLRGLNSVRGWSQTLKIMIDGQPVSFRTGNTYFLDEPLIPIRVIKRIEVIRGPASALYGANAFLGVVNIITQDLPTKEMGGDASVGLGVGGKLASSQGHPKKASGDLLVSGAPGPAAFLLAAAYTYSDRSGLALPDPVPNKFAGKASEGDIARPASLYGKFGVGPFVLSGNYQHFDTHGEFTDFSVLTHQDRLAVDLWHLRGDYVQAFGKRLEGRFFVARSAGNPTKQDHLDTGSATTWTKRELGVASWDAGAELHYRPTEDSSLIAGLDYTKDDQQLQNNILVSKIGLPDKYASTTVLGRKDFTNTGAFLQGILPLGHRINFTGGLRWDDHNLYGGVLNWRAALVGDLAPQVHLKLMHGTSFKAPTPRELYDVAGTSRGNPDLEPQKAGTTEAALEWAEGRLGGGFSLFATEIRDYIQLVPPATPIPGVTKVYENLGRIRSRGAAAHLRFFKGLVMGYLNAAYQHSEDQNTGQETTLVPHWTANLGADYAFARCLLNLEGSYVGPRTSPKAATVVYANPPADRRGFELGSSTLFNLTLTTREFSLLGHRSTLLTVGIRNLLDKAWVDPGYENQGIDVPHLGRTFVVRVVQRF